MAGKKMNYNLEEALNVIFTMPHKELTKRQIDLRKSYKSRYNKGSLKIHGTETLLKAFGVYVHTEAIYRFKKKGNDK